jgi:O-antigen/teichoic acid export membrane protein
MESAFAVDDCAFKNNSKDGLKRLSVHGGVASIAGQCVKFVLNLGSTIVLARLLTPDDFGLIAMVTAITGFIMIFREFGLSQATIQRREISPNQVSTLFWINFAIGCLLTLTTIAIAPVIAWLYKDNRLLSVTIALSTVFFFNGLTVQHDALLRRQMRLVAIAIRDTVALAAGILIAIICAWAGMCFWGLLWMQVVTAAVTAGGAWLASGWIPGRPVRRSGVRSMLKYGGWLTGAGLLNYFARNLDNILIGRYCGPGPLGLYARSYSLLLLPIGQIVSPLTSVAVPALSKLQNEPERYKKFYLRVVKVLAYVSFPLFIAFVVLAKQIILLTLGDKWLGTLPIFRILSVTALIQPIVSTVGWLYVSQGLTRRMALWGIVTSVFICTSFIVGLPWGPMGVATSYSLCMIILIYPEIYVATIGGPLSPKDVFEATWRPLFLSLLIGCGMFLVLHYSSVQIPIIAIVISALGGLIVGILAYRCWHEVRQDIGEIVSIWLLLRTNI